MLETPLPSPSIYGVTSLGIAIFFKSVVSSTPIVNVPPEFTWIALSAVEIILLWYNSPFSKDEYSIPL